MYVVWRSRQVKGKGGGVFLPRDDNFLGNLVCYQPLECRHRGENRVSRIAYVMRAERVDGKPRQRIIERLPAIRTCCIVDQFNRAAWWHHANVVIGCWDESEPTDPRVAHFARDRADIFAKLRAVVPRPTAKGQAEFDAYRLEKEREWEARDRSERDWWSTEGPGSEQAKQKRQAKANGWQPRGPFDESYVDFNRRFEADRVRREQEEQTRRA